MYYEKCPIIFSAMRKKQIIYLLGWFSFWEKNLVFLLIFILFIHYLFFSTTNCFKILLFFFLFFCIFICLFCTACFETKEAERQIFERKTVDVVVVKEKHEVGILRILIKVEKKSCVCVFFRILKILLHIAWEWKYLAFILFKNFAGA